MTELFSKHISDWSKSLFMLINQKSQNCKLALTLTLLKTRAEGERWSSTKDPFLSQEQKIAMTYLMYVLEYSNSRQVDTAEWVWQTSRQPRWCEGETAQIHWHMYTEALYFSHPLTKSNLLRPFYDSLTKLRSMEITFSWLDIPLSCLSRPTSEG